GDQSPGGHGHRRDRRRVRRGAGRIAGRPHPRPVGRRHRRPHRRGVQEVPASMKVLLLSQYFFPEVGATQTRMYEFARALTDAGHEVTVLTEFPNHPTGVIPARYAGRWLEDDRSHRFRVVRVRVLVSPRKTFCTRLMFYGSFFVMAT